MISGIERQTVWRSIPEIIHKINHDYRNVLSQLFGDSSQPSEEMRRREEKRTLESACQKIANIFSALTHVRCTVTVKFIVRNDDGRAYCETLVRSEMNSKRDEAHRQVFDLHTGANSAYDEALRYTPGETSHFFSADLTKDKTYRNQRQNWASFYRSAIVVPIRYVDPKKVGTPGASDHIGLLAVDTHSENRLKRDGHVEFLAAFADQMYNFMSLMRGKYVVPRNEH